MTLLVGEVCAGISAASLAWHPLGWRPAWFAELAAFPSAVLAHHHADVPNHGDFTGLVDIVRAGLAPAATAADKAAAWTIARVDILMGGTPCQDFSIAGLRQSLAGDRGNLTLEFLRLADAIDDLRRAAGAAPLAIAWENVPGVLSTPDNAFGAFLGGLVGGDAALARPTHGGWQHAGMVDGPRRCAAWRLLDAQHFGLAQRRQRVFVLARGGAGRWAAPDALLPLVESVRWHPAPRRGTRQDIAGTLSSRTEGGGGLGTDFELGGARRDLTKLQQHTGGGNAMSLDVSTTLGAKGGAGRMDFESETFVTHALKGEGHDASEDGTGRGVPLTIMGALSASDGGVSGKDAPQVVAYRTTGNDGCYETGDKIGALNTGTDLNANVVAVSIRGRDGGATAELYEGDGAPALKASQGGGDKPHVMTLAAVRRLTPRECERLQGFPDDHTLVPVRGKPAADGPRYKALGNSIAVPCLAHIGRNLARALGIATIPRKDVA